PLPFALEFRLDAIVSVTLIFLVSASETIGDTTALAMMGLRRPAMQREVSGSLATDGLVSSLSAVFGCMPITSFSQNIGLVALTKVVNRFAIMTGAVIMLAAGLFPWFGKILATLPEPVLGGCTLMMFGSIVLAGVRMLSKCIESQRNMTIASLSLAIGIGFTQAPAIFNICPQILKDVLAGNSVAVVFLVAVILNIVLPSEKASGEPVNVD
ncbi:MAG: purine permease, partial [Duodenibacillus sp.]|nr:purine permease [Duodenibacillus sp.]